MYPALKQKKFNRYTVNLFCFAFNFVSVENRNRQQPKSPVQ
jgi:hypothetical protein